MLINVLNLTSLTFAFILSYICMCGSGSWKLLNTDPDPQHWLAVRVNLSQLHGGKPGEGQSVNNVFKIHM